MMEYDEGVIEGTVVILIDKGGVNFDTKRDKSSSRKSKTS